MEISYGERVSQRLSCDFIIWSSTENNQQMLHKKIAKSAETVEYTKCTSAEG